MRPGRRQSRLSDRGGDRNGSIDRRTFLGVLPITAAALGCRGTTGDAAASTDEESRAPGEDQAGVLLSAVGVQLYTLRDVIAEDLDRVLASLAEIGYDDVELFQLHGLTPAQMRARLDAVGLTATSSHYDLALLRDDLQRHIDGALEIGHDQMVVPWLGEEHRTAEGVARVAGDFDRIGTLVQEAGMRFGYHNHDFEFAEVAPGTTMMDALLAATDPAVVEWQMDIFWTVHGGEDPFRQLEAHAGRITSVHVKDRSSGGDMVDVGDGVIDFGAVLAAAEAQGLRHAFVEHDNPVDAVESARKAYAHLRSIGVVG